MLFLYTNYFIHLLYPTPKEKSFPTNKKLKNLINKYSSISQKLVKDSPLMPGIKKFLTQIKKKKVKIVLVTNADHYETKIIIKYRGLEKFFDEILGRPKSKIVNIKSFLKKQEYKKIIFFGDALNDYKVAEKLKFDFYIL